MLKKVLVFGLITVVTSVIMVFAYEDKFPRVAYCPPWAGGNSTYNQYFTQAESTLHLTGLIILGGDPSFTSDDFIRAQTHHLNLVNQLNWFYGTGQYSMYQADRINEYDWFQPYDLYNQIRFLSTKYDNAGHGRQYDGRNDPDTTISNGFAWYVSKDSANDNPGYVLYDLWNETTDPTLPPGAIDYSREQDWADRTFHVIFRLKVPQTAGCDSADTVAKLEVRSYTGIDTNYTILAESSLLYGSLPHDQYQACTLLYDLQSDYSGWPPSDTNAKDYRVYWYKNTDLYIDYIEVFDEHYSKMFFELYPNSNYTVYEYELRNNDTIQSQNDQFGDSSLYRWYVHDQPQYDQFRSSKKVDTILQDKGWAPGVQAYCRQPYRYLDEFAPYPQELVYDDYPIYTLPENDNDTLQATLDAFAGRLWKVNDAAKSKNKKWWYIAHTYQADGGLCDPDDTTKICRYPHNSELRAAVYMALAYGATGIGYYRYYTTYKGNAVDQGGLVDDTLGPIQTYPYNDYYANSFEYLFNEVKDINQKLDTLGPILQKLEWKWAGSSDSLIEHPESFVATVTGVECDSCHYSCHYPIYDNHIQVGTFKDDSLAEDYLMLVNRWVGYDQKPCERVQLQKGRISYLYDSFTGQLLDTLGGSGIFHVILYPGEGKLFRFANFLPSTLSISRQSYPQRFNLNWTDPDTVESGYKIERRFSL